MKGKRIIKLGSKAALAGFLFFWNPCVETSLLLNLGMVALLTKKERRDSLEDQSEA